MSGADAPSDQATLVRADRPRPTTDARLGKDGADGQTRTADRRFTKPLLYRLSYVGADFLMIVACLAMRTNQRATVLKTAVRLVQSGRL